jgi:hypothetical protein
VDIFDPRFNIEPFARTGPKLIELAFPLGGIGTGCVSLDGRGALIDWEVFASDPKGVVQKTAGGCKRAIQNRQTGTGST